MKNTMKMLTDRELSDFCSQLAMVLDAGLSLQEGLDMMQTDSQDENEQKVIASLQGALGRSGSFGDALAESPFFPDYMVQMVHMGEQTGHLDDVMRALAEHYDRNDSVRQSIRSAVLYPVMMFCMMVLIIIVLLTQVMPIFNQVFLQLGAELSGISRSLLNLGAAIKNYGVVLVVLALVLAAAAAFICWNPGARKRFAHSFSKIGWVRSLYDTLFRFRLAGGMAMTLSSGTDADSALDMIKDLSDDPVSLERVQACREYIQQGEELSAALCKSELFPGIQGRMVAIGQRTGTLDQVMQQLAKTSQEEFDQKIAKMLSLIEPVLVMILSVIVGIILMSVMFPLLGILAGI